MSLPVSLKIPTLFGGREYFFLQVPREVSTVVGLNSALSQDFAQILHLLKLVR